MPNRSDDYQLASWPKTKIDRDLWNAVMGDIAARLKDRELLEASFELLQQQGIQAALDYIQVSIAPQLSALAQTISDSQARIDELLQGNAPNAQKLGGQPPAYYAKAAETAEALNGLTDELAAVSSTFSGILATLAGTRRDATINRDQLRGVPIVTATNLLIRSGEPTHSQWAVGGVTKAAFGIAPDGSNTAVKFNETAATSDHVVTNSTQGLVAGQPYTQSIFVKAAERTKFRVRLATNLGFLGDAAFDLVSGVVLSKSGSVIGTEIEKWDDGWWRVSATAIAPAGATGASGGKFYILNDAAVVNYLGEVGKGLYLWGGQVENNAVKMGPYVPTTTASATMSIYSNRHLAEELAAKVADLQSAINNIAVVPIGTIIDVYGNGTATFPGFLKVVPGLEITSAYPELRTWALANGWATNASGNPVMPNTDALFKRGWRSGQTRDAGRAFGSVQEDALKAHNHIQAFYNPPTSALTSGRYGGTETGVSTNSDQTSGASGTTGAYTSTEGAAETRPANLTVTWYIKAYPAAVSSGSIDVAKLADDIASVASRSTALEAKSMKKTLFNPTTQSSLLVTGINPAVKRITLNLAVNFAAVATMIIRLGTSGGLISSGYQGYCGAFNQGGTGAYANDTGMPIGQNAALATRFRGKVILERIGASNSWNMSWMGDYNNPPGGIQFSTAQIDTLTALSQIQITTVAGTQNLNGFIDYTEEY